MPARGDRKSSSVSDVPRTVVVRSLSARGETIGVLHAAFHVAIWAAIVVSIQAAGGSSDAKKSAVADVPPFVQTFLALASDEQRMVRNVQEGLGEAERRRVSDSAWPDVGALAADGVPPFARDPLDKDHYAWTRFMRRGLVNYVGLPTSADRPTYVVIVTEPDPSTPDDPSIKADEIHHRLSSGVLIHTGIFMGRGFVEAKAPVPSVPFDEGWKQVLAGSAADVLGR